MLVVAVVKVALADVVIVGAAKDPAKADPPLPDAQK